jgi:hypothetical protein
MAMRRTCSTFFWFFFLLAHNTRVSSAPVRRDEGGAQSDSMGFATGDFSLDASPIMTYLPKDHFSTSQQTRHGHCAGHPWWYPQVHYETAFLIGIKLPVQRGILH